jgi:hypothetical protein
VAIELLLGLRARSTKDLDATVRLADEDIAPRLRAALAHGWEGFTLRLTGLEQVRDTAARRGDIKVSYQGDPWSTVQFEVSPAEGAAGHQIHWTDNMFVDPEYLVCRLPASCRWSRSPISSPRSCTRAPITPTQSVPTIATATSST